MQAKGTFSELLSLIMKPTHHRKGPRRIANIDPLSEPSAAALSAASQPSAAPRSAFQQTPNEQVK